MAKNKKVTTPRSIKPKTDEAVTSIKHSAKRKNIPPAGLEAQGIISEAGRIKYEYNPHLPPILRFAPEAAATDRLPDLLQTARKRPLSDLEASILANALKKHEPWLEWSGKREKPWFEVEPVALHIHERLSTQAILRVLAREDVQRDLFADPQQSYAQAVQFYQHDVDWANRMILGDSLQVMASLSHREDLSGRIQMIYFDPPYGINFKSNFQPKLGQREVKDREQDLTREPEMVKAYRDTWTLGVHSYLSYLRDRLFSAKILLSDSGSIFVQISDENTHRVRCLMDEVFGAMNAVATIAYKKSAPATKTIKNGFNYLLWYCKDRERIRVRKLFRPRTIGEGTTEDPKKLALWLRLPDGSERSLTTEEKREDTPLPEGAKVFRADKVRDSGKLPEKDFVYEFHGEKLAPGPSHSWRGRVDEMDRLKFSDRLLRTEETLAFKLFMSDSGGVELTSLWEDTAGKIPDMIYAVQTNVKVIERCLLMTTDPGDLVLDPTCGGGTTAFSAEKWGRRWITIDTSRVALALAKQRLMTAQFSYYTLRAVSAEDVSRNPNGTWLIDPSGQIPGKCTFQYETVPHIKLKSIARNTSLDPIFSKHKPILDEKLTALNAELKKVKPDLRKQLAAKLLEKQKREGKKAITEADHRRWDFPTSDWKEWEVPFDTDNDWPKPLQEALVEYRNAWRAKMDDVNTCIAANAELEELVDRPEEHKGVVRVSGPFTMEGVIALEDGLDTPIAGAPDEDMETFEGTADLGIVNAEAHLDKVLRLLKASGVDFPGNKHQKFVYLAPITEASLLHAEGEWVNGTGKERRVAVSIGPEVGNITAFQVEEAVRVANRRGYDDLVFAGFGFDAAAQDAIEHASHPNLRIHMALIRPDVAMGDLLKTQPGSQIFTVFSAPRINGPTEQSDGQYIVEVEGMDVYDPVSNALFPTDKERIAAWFLDSDYDGRTFCICQAFFPDKSKWDKLARALGEKGIIEEDKFEALSGLRSLPFARPPRLGPGEKWRVAVKVIDPRGNEGLRVTQLP